MYKKPQKIYKVQFRLELKLKKRPQKYSNTDLFYTLHSTKVEWDKAKFLK